ncbi:MAG: endonuclease/exonuclease/phosphatase family protein [Acidobacteriota bacterium]
MTANGMQAPDRPGPNRPSASRSRRAARWIIALVALVAAMTAAVYCVSRLTSSARAVRTLVFAEGDPAPLRPSGEIRIGAFNIAHGRGPELGATNWQGRTRGELIAHLDAIARQIRRADLDVVVLNEVDFSAAWSGHFDQAEFVARRAGYRHLVEQRNYDLRFPFLEFAFGNAVLSRFPVVETRFLDLPAASPWEDRLAGHHDALWVALDAASGLLGVVAVHLEYRSEKVRVAAAKTFLDLKARSGIPIILAGDFNSTPGAYPGHHVTASGQNAIDVLTENGGFVVDPRIAPVESAFTFPAAGPARVIDWVLATPDLEVTSWVVPSALSDHLMVAASVRPATRGLRPRG